MAGTFESNRLFLPVVGAVLMVAALLLVFWPEPDDGCAAPEILKGLAPDEIAAPCDQNTMGDLYYYGDGVPQDHTVALHWFRLAAEQDFADAQHNLGEMYFNGEGVGRDTVEAYKWLTLAAEVEWSPVGKAAGEFRKKLTTLMTPAEVEAGQALADAWIATHRGE